jgi:septal ring factor EnvC (AmiA/AmiB activator)
MGIARLVRNVEKTLVAEHRPGPRHVVALLVALVLPLGLSLGAQAQSDRPIALDALKQHDQELEAARAEQLKAADTEKKLRQEIDSIGDDRRKLTQSLIDTAARVRLVEGQIVEAEARLNPLTDRELTIRKSLEGRRSVIAEVLAALQRVGRRPPPALLLKPEDALQAVRTAVMFGAVLPEMRAEAEVLSRDLGDLVHLREEIAKQREQLAHDLAELSENRQRMTLLNEQRKQQQGDAQKALEGERARVAQLGRQVDSLKDLIGKLEQNLDPATRNARVAARTAEEGKQLGDTRPDLAALRDPGRLAPAIAFASARGALPFPVNGVKIRDFGASDGTGGTEKGLSIATRPGAQVTAPCDGWVVYAAPYRSYGQLLILNAGGGYHILLTGMDRISVDLGQFVLTGEPVAVMGSGPQVASATAAGSSQPVLYIEFRKDGTPVDPTPWWTTTENEKVRG